MFGVSSDDLLPRRAADGGWEPAAYVAGRGARVEGAQAAPTAVPPVGLEPTTFGLKGHDPEPKLGQVIYLTSWRARRRAAAPAAQGA